MTSTEKKSALQGRLNPLPDELGLPAYIFIIGAMKSGTTTLFEHLANHPQICPSTPKEPGFFATEECWAMGAAWYDSLFDFNPAHHAYALDGSTDYTKHPFCSGIVERLNQNSSTKIKMIYIMRHPLRRIESHARWVATTGKEVWQNKSPRPDHSLDGGVSPVSLAVSQYASQLDQYKDFYERGDILLLTMEEMELDPVATLRRVFNHLDVDTNHEINIGSIQNKSNSKKTTLNPLWSAAANIPSLLFVIKAIVPNSVRKFLRKKTGVPLNIQGRFNLLPTEEEKLLGLLKDDLKKLQNHYGVDIRRWWSLEV